MYPLAAPAVADLFDDVIADPENDLHTALARIPTMFGISDKATYLCYRSLGLTPTQSLQCMERGEELLAEWQEENDQWFLKWESMALPHLQSTVAADLIKLGWMKNMALLVAKDTSIILKANASLELLTKREYEYLGKIRPHYSPSDLLALDKVLHPGDHQPNINITLSWGNEEVIEGVQATYQIEGADNDNHQHNPDEAHFPNLPL